VHDDEDILTDLEDPAVDSVASRELWTALTAEFDSERLGALWLAEVRRVVAAVVRGYPPGIYAATGAWDDAAHDDVTQDVVINRLLGEAQIEYIALNSVGGLAHARRLLARQVKRELARRRQRTVIDNLFDRALEYLKSEKSGAKQVSENPRVWVMGGKIPAQDQRDQSESKARLLSRLRRLPRLASRGEERAPVVWSSSTLETAVDDVLGSMASVSERELDEILRVALTSFTLGVLSQDDGEERPPNDPLGPEDVLVVESLVRQLTDVLEIQERHVMALKSVGLADADIATAVGVSRPTVAKIRKGAGSKSADVVRGASEPVLREVLKRFADELLVEFDLLESLEKPE